ncbi:MAG: hypothetical protein KC486_08030 [Myxococcales bacterium]|nr:hypothetical protein [Myxococcales bacterium]
MRASGLRRCARVVGGVLLAGALSGCRPPPHPPTPCSLRAPGGDEAAAATQRIPAAVWLDLLVPDNRDASDPLAAMHTCTGAALTVDSLGRDARVMPAGDAPALRITAVDDARALLWAPLRDYDDGDALGPVALLRRHAPEDGGAHLELLALGALRAPSRASLRLERLADGAEVVVAEGERCAGEERCVREIQLLPRAGERLIDAPLRSVAEDGPARLAVALAAGLGDSGGVRTAALERTLRGGPDGLMIVEVLRVQRCAGSEGEGCADEATLRRERPLSFDGERLHAPPSLWPPPGWEGGEA